MHFIIAFVITFSVIKCETGAEKILQESDELGFKYYPEIGWVHYNPIPTTWTEARTRCYHQYATLMSPVNDEMQRMMSDAADSALWTGIHATDSQGNYFSINGEPLNKMPVTWALDEPDNDNNNESCLLMLPDGKMADRPCDEPHPFICHKTNNFKTALCGHLPGYEFDNTINSCYKFHNLAKNWSRAFMICAEEGAHLAVIDSKGEVDVLKQLFSQYPKDVMTDMTEVDYIHLGFHDWDNHNLWMTINGKDIDELVADKVVAWKAGEPNNFEKNEYCGGMRRDGSINDVGCHYKLAFICEYET